MSSIPTPSEYETFVDRLERHIEDLKVDYERESNTLEQEEGEEPIQAEVFRFQNDTEIDFFLGVREDNPYAEIIFEFDLIPPIANQLDVEQAEEIIEIMDIEYEIEKIDHEGTQQLAKIKRAVDNDELEKLISDTQLTDLVSEAEDDEAAYKELEQTQKRFYATLLALDHIDSNRTAEIYLQLRRIITDMPVKISIDISDNSGFRGFRLRYRLYPYGETKLTVQDIYDAFWYFVNMGHYGEMFLKHTFNIGSEPPDFFEVDISSTMNIRNGTPQSVSEDIFENLGLLE